MVSESSSLPRGARSWLRHRPNLAHRLTQPPEPFTAEMLLDTDADDAPTLPDTTIQAVIERGFVERVAWRTGHEIGHDHDHIPESDAEKPSGHRIGLYRVPRPVRRFIEADIPMPAADAGFCESPDCASTHIEHGADGPRCSCGAPPDRERVLGEGQA